MDEIREDFETFMKINLMFSPDELEFQEKRNCYKEYYIHLAWQAWREAHKKYSSDRKF